MQRKLKVGIIGCGRIAGFLQDDHLRAGVVTHMGAYRSFPRQVSVVACASRTVQQVDSFGDRFAIPNRYTDYRSMLKHESLDIVSVCAYADSRYQMIRDIVRSGVRGIFCEKPIAASLAETEKIIALCEQHNVRLSVNHTRRWGHDYRTVKQLIDAGRLGDIRSVVGYFSGALFHTGTHMFDIANFLFGVPQNVAARLIPDTGSFFTQLRDNPDAFQDFDGVGTVMYPHDVNATFVGVAKDYFIFELDIQGSKGRVRIGNNVLEIYQAKKSPHYTGFKELAKVATQVKKFRYSPLAWAVHDLIQSVRLNKPVVSSARDAYNALAIACGMCESHKKGCCVVPFPLKNKTMKVRAR